MTDETFVSIDVGGLQQLAEIVGEVNLVTDEEKVDKLSKDFFWYSPLLREKLTGKRAAAVVRVERLEALKQVVSLAYRSDWPITVRGGGTGNYGQCIPLAGGLVIDMSGLDKIHSIADGVVRAEPGARLGTLELAARKVGFEFRCLPSTWVKSSLAGFLCGGSGGIGSITWGAIANADNVKSVTLMSAEAEPRLIKFEERAAIDALHTYGTTGIMVEVEMRLGPKRPYHQMIICSKDWHQLIDWTDKIARRTDIPKRLVTQFEHPVPTYFKPLKKYLAEDAHATFLLVDESCQQEVVEDAQLSGFEVVYNEPLSDPLKPPYITDYTWNHGTLWAIKADPNYTYLQLGYGQNFREKINMLRDCFPGEIFQHLEWTAWSNRKQGDHYLPIEAEDINVGGLPKIYYKSAERLAEIMAKCEEIGVGIANPHTFVLEEGGRHPNIGSKVAIKTNLDPKGLLNPGKMKSYPVNPFLKATA